MKNEVMYKYMKNGDFFKYSKYYYMKLQGRWSYNLNKSKIEEFPSITHVERIKATIDIKE